MSQQVLLEVGLIFLLVLLNGFLSGSELAVVSARKHRLRQRADAGDDGARTALELADEPNRFLSTVQIGITLVGILAGVFGGATLAEEIGILLEDAGVSEGWAGILSVAAVVAGITYLSLVFGELVPKRLALAHPELIARLVARPLRVLSVIGTPLVALLSISTEVILRLLRVRSVSDDSVTEEEVQMMLLESASAGVFEPAEQEIAAAALVLGDRSVHEVVTPRTEVSWLDFSRPTEAILQQMAEQQHHWYPVIDGTPDKPLGCLALKEVFRAERSGEPFELPALLHPPEYLPETASLVRALNILRRTPVPLAFVVDEFGGTTGIVTVTDVLGALVGAFSDSSSSAQTVRQPDGAWLLDGRSSWKSAFDTLGIDEPPPDGDFHTVAGFVLDQLGRVPNAGDAFEWAGFRFEVARMEGRRVDLVKARGVAARETP